MSNKYKVLIVEDDLNICNFVKTILSTHSYQVLVANNCKGGDMMFHSHCPDLLILDLGLPDGDGIELIKSIRETSDTPIIVLSARTNETDKVEALDTGANDYVTKPFGTDELLARVRVALRNNRNGDNDGIGMNQFAMNGLFINYEDRSVNLNGEEIKLTQTEYNIVQLLSVYAGRVLTYTEIIKKIWGYSDNGSVKKLQVNMANIRKKLGEKPGENKYISNELGVGYRMNSPEEK